MALYTLAVPLWGWHSHQITSTECDFLGGCSGQLVKRVGLRKVEVSTGLGVTGVREDRGGEGRNQAWRGQELPPDHILQSTEPAAFSSCFFLFFFVC